MAYVETPRTDAGNSTYMPNGYGLDNISAENTFMSPSKREHDLVSQMRNGRGVSLKTPRSRVPFGDRRNLPVAPAQGEFTPLLKSVAKKNLQRSGKHNGVPETPAFLKRGYKGAGSPALPIKTPGTYSEDTGSSIGASDEATPVPQIASSSAQVTPLATLPKRNAEGVLTDQGNVFTLREQENIINKIEKENFGLKLKIHFLEESLRKSGPGFHEVALKENTDLKVDKVTMQKELSRARKTLERTEREVEVYQKQLQNAHDQTKRKHADKQMQEELESLKKEIARKDAELQDYLCDDVEQAAGKDAEIEKLKSDIDDLEIDNREKDRLLDDREDEIEGLKGQAERDAEELSKALQEAKSGEQRNVELEKERRTTTDQAAQLHQVNEELADARCHIEDLEKDIERSRMKADDAHEKLQEARQAKEKAEADIEELHDEMSNKSFSSKGLTRQLEEKIQRLQEEAAALRDKGSKSKQEAHKETDRLQDENNSLKQRLETIDQKCSTLTTQLQEVTENLERKAEEKELLHSRHDALTTESKSLQQDLTRSQAQVKKLERELEAERSHALENDQQLQAEAEDEIRQLSDEVNSLQRELDEKDSQQAAEQDLWESQRRALESDRDRSNEQRAGLQRTIDKLQEAEGTLSGREHKLQEAVESEKQRYESQEAGLKRDLEDLDADISDKRKQLADSRSELARVNEELRVSRRNESTLEEKIQGLEDEVNILQDSLDEEAAKAKDETATARREADSLKRQLQSAKQELKRAEAYSADARAELETYQGDLKAGNGSREQLDSRLRTVELELQKVRADRQSLQDRLAQNDLEMHDLRSLLEDVEAERDQIKTQLKHVDAQADLTFSRDQEKSELRKANLKLEAELSQIKEVRDALLEKNDAVEKEMEEEIQRASIEEVRLNDQIAELKRKVNASSGSKDRELTTARQRVRQLEDQIQELEDRAAHGQHSNHANTELSVFQKDLSAARKKEIEIVQRESAQREVIRDLKHKVTRLERQVHEAELAKLEIDSPKSSVGGSARRSEVAELRSQLSDAHQQLKDLRSKSRDTEKEFRRKLSEAERESQANIALADQEREQLEQELSTLRHDQESEQSKLVTAEKTISRLRSRIHGLESSLRDARNGTIGDRTMADERKDLHEMLKDAKLEAEDLQLQISTRESNLQSAATREEELRGHLQRVRNERTHQQKKSSALLTELDALQSRYEHAVENLSRQQKTWEAERKAMNSRVRFANTSISEHRDDKDVQELQLVVQAGEKRHASEINGMATQIGWLRWKLEREEDFRNCLKFEKSYLTTQIKMYEAWYVVPPPFTTPVLFLPSTAHWAFEMTYTFLLNSNKLDLALMKKNFGIDVKDFKPEPKRRPSLRTWAHMVVFTLRCKRYADEWREQKKVKVVLNKALEVARREQLRERIERAGRG
ncbi:MAG: hypothetical protein Q9170_004635 [Blastenia crenularia]